MADLGLIFLRRKPTIHWYQSLFTVITESMPFRYFWATLYTRISAPLKKAIDSNQHGIMIASISPGAKVRFWAGPCFTVHPMFFMVLLYFEGAQSESGWCNSCILEGFEIFKMAAKMAAKI